MVGVGILIRKRGGSGRGEGEEKEGPPPVGTDLSRRKKRGSFRERNLQKEGKGGPEGGGLGGLYKRTDEPPCPTRVEGKGFNIIKKVKLFQRPQ